jgi:hypothetical protein
MIKKQFSRAQRSEIAKWFNDDLSNCLYYAAMGPTLKAMLAESVRLYFMPNNLPDDKLPPVSCDERIKKDKEGTIVEHKYIFDLELSIPGFTNNTMVLKFHREADKSIIDNVV